MSEHYQAVKVTDEVYWVGAIDWGIRDWHGYAIPRGTTYNAYLVLGEKAALIDTVRAPFFGEMRARIASVVDPAKVAYLISNHAELDHSGAIPETIAALRPEKVFASTLGVKALQDHFHLDQEITAVKEGESLELGKLTLTFAEMRMLHWPDSMATYLAQPRILFSNDAFGMHLATSQRFDDELEQSLLEQEAATYYANILMPLSALIPRAVEKVGRLGEPARPGIRTIAPSHGPIWRERWPRIVELYSAWAAGKRTRKAVVAYDTMWKSTAMMARAVGEGLAAGGVTVKVMPLQASSRSEVAAELLEAGALLVGSSTLNNTMLPRVADLLNYLKGLRPKNLVGAAFGSYGWSGEAVGQIEAVLGEMKVELAGEGVKVVYGPDGEALGRCYDLGKVTAEKLLEKIPA
jgi:flavorubredoxin